MHSAVLGVLDTDMHGTTGRGTIFFMEINIDGVIERHEWGLLEELSGKFNKQEKLKAYYEAVNKSQAELNAKATEEKKAELEAKKSSVVYDKQLLSIIDEVILSETKSIEQYKAGKEKALNAVVGKVIGLVKKNNISSNAFDITHILKEKLKE